MAGILYAVGVGPGDPELLTLKAVKVINKADVIACPAKGGTAGVAYEIAKEACPEIEKKEKILLDFPMKEEGLGAVHQEAAKRIGDALWEGKSVAFLTLGDPGFYSTFFYISEMVSDMGFEIQIVSGVTSFSGISARLNIPIALGRENVLITTGEFRDFDGTLIVMKAGSKLKELKTRVIECGKKAWLVENCGMESEKVYEDVHVIPDEVGYFSVLIVK